MVDGERAADAETFAPDVERAVAVEETLAALARDDAAESEVGVDRFQRRGEGPVVVDGPLQRFDGRHRAIVFETVLKTAAMDISEFTTENMKPLVGTSWRLEAPNGQQYDLELVDVVLLPQAAYPLSNDTIGGPHLIFIVPTAREQRGYRYEAIFT